MVSVSPISYAWANMQRCAHLAHVALRYRVLPKDPGKAEATGIPGKLPFTEVHFYTPLFGKYFSTVQSLFLPDCLSRVRQ